MSVHGSQPRQAAPAPLSTIYPLFPPKLSPIISLKDRVGLQETPLDHAQSRDPRVHLQHPPLPGQPHGLTDLGLERYGEVSQMTL